MATLKTASLLLVVCILLKPVVSSSQDGPLLWFVLL